MIRSVIGTRTAQMMMDLTFGDRPRHTQYEGHRMQIEDALVRFTLVKQGFL
jgi:hypothetical protein